MSNLKIGPVDISAGTASFNTGGLTVGTNQLVANVDGTVSAINGSHVFGLGNHTLSGTQATTLTLSGGAGYYKEISFKTGANERWRVLSGGSTESGGNVGSNFYISRYTDAGAFIDSPIYIDRASGAVSISTSINIPSLDIAANDTRGANTSFVKSCLDNIADRTAGDSTSSAANTRFVTNAIAASAGTKVTTFNGRSGVVTLNATDVINALGYTPANPSNIVTGIKVGNNVAKTGEVTFTGELVYDMGTYIEFKPNGSSGFCVHPYSLVALQNGTEKFALDIRPGEVLQGNNKVLGVLNSTLSTRSWVEVNNKAVVTSDHLVKLQSGWSVQSKTQYSENYLGKKFPCKTLFGMKEITSDFGSPEDFQDLELGLTLSTGQKITSIKEFKNSPNHPVIALYTEQDSFFVDGIEVASMGREVEVL